jgi:hypothetical protein
VDTTNLPGGDAARIRVLASDGFNTSSDDSEDGFVVAPKPPSVRILSPESGTAAEPDSPLFLQGYAYDLEDGPLESAALRWMSNQDGMLGTGTLILSTPSSGHHVVTLEATDADGNTAKDAVNVFVGHRAYLPIVLRNW